LLGVRWRWYVDSGDTMWSFRLTQSDYRYKCRLRLAL
jgi:hypothetical protein